MCPQQINDPVMKALCCEQLDIACSCKLRDVCSATQLNRATQHFINYAAGQLKTQLLIAPQESSQGKEKKKKACDIATAPLCTLSQNGYGVGYMPA